MDATDRTETPEWPLRPWVLAAGLALAGLVISFFTSGTGEQDAGRMAATAFVLFGSLAAAFTADRGAWKEPLLFALAAGLVMAGLAWRAVSAGEQHSDEDFAVAAGVVTLALALPLFQAGFHRRGFATPYARVHRQVWSDAICAAGSLAFVAAAWLLIALLAELFHLLRIDLLRDLMEKEWFGWTYSGAAFGAALGTLRNQLGVLATLQAVVMLVLSILAVPLAAGLALFLAAMIVSGPEVLWDATRSASPVLLLCSAGAWLLANVIVRGGDADMVGSRALRWAAIALTASVLPLAAFAAVSLGLRIDQHGLSPERIWGAIVIAGACVYGAVWLAALARGFAPGDWPGRLRRANLRLAALICVVAFILALPIFDFGAIAARQQIARLERGAVSAQDFDYAALRWDFGDAGRRALARLARSGDAQTAQLAALAARQPTRARPVMDGPFRRPEEIDVRVVPESEGLRRLVLDHLRVNGHLCRDRCAALDLGPADGGGRDVAFIEGDGYQRAVLPAKAEPPARAEPPAARRVPPPSGAIEIRAVPTRYIFVDGRAIGPPLDDASALEAGPPPR